MKEKHSFLEILYTALKLGLTSFGGPVAHLGFFKDEYVDKKKWLDDKTYADIIALCQFLPGPASSQVGIAIGMLRGGIFGGIISWIGFTLPSVVVLVLFAFLYQTYTLDDVSWIASLKIVAVAVVAHAVLGLGKKLTTDLTRISIAVMATVILLLFPSTLIQIGIIVIAGLLGFFLFSEETGAKVETFSISVTKRQGVIALLIFFTLLIGLPLLSSVIENEYFHQFDIFFRVGSIVFGGGHVVLPLLEQELIPLGLISTSEFLAGYGMAQAVPGPLFTFASYVGTMMSGILGAFIATIAMFLPSFLLVIGAMPFLSELRKSAKFRGVLAGVNASVVGILLAALYDPVFTSSIHNGVDFGLAILLFSLLYFWKVPAWLVVVTGVVLGILMSNISF